MSVTTKITDSPIDNTMDINVLYFAGLADEANCHEEKITVQKSTSLTDLYEQLSQKHRFSRPQSELRVAVNDYFVKWIEVLNDGDNVVFILPVAGG
ncbi:MoaD/ThiS family protein [Psychrobacter urativorans]|uniref:Molybdopterin synthase sulfur carrier subunit n=1 Tax=Psychrobacter urativorans TaxID=45610 RepID=A0A0M3V926_9GAMM|nr:MoaD/ThiS family protein [Psychrobacter urativorans]ALF60213.1 molybdopterin converting factor [Psychrobacter urativorans]